MIINVYIYIYLKNYVFINTASKRVIREFASIFNGIKDRCCRQADICIYESLEHDLNRAYTQKCQLISLQLL